MKNKAFYLKVFALIIAITAALSMIVLADSITKQKLVLTYNEDDNTLDMGVYISKGTAIVGYCSFDYDEEKLVLLDKEGEPVPEKVPSKASDGKSIYLTDVIKGKGGVEITDVGKGSSKLIDVKDGHLFFAWFLPSSISYIDASKDEVLIATATFSLADGVETDDLDKSCVSVAGKDITDKVSGWFAGLVVLDKDQKRFTYDGKGTNTALFECEFIIDGEKAEDEPDKDEDKTEAPKDNEDETPEDNKTADDKNDTSKDDNKAEDKVENPDEEKSEDKKDEVDSDKTDDKKDEAEDNSKDEDKSDEDTPEEKPEEEPEDEPVISSKPDFKIDGDAIVAKEIDFDISARVDTNSIRIKWSESDKFNDVISYTLFICDNEFNAVKVISGISSLSTSYSVSDLASSFDYKIYLVATSKTGYASSEVISVSTDSEADVPTTFVANVFYDSGDGYLYGLSSELCVFGESPSKIPVVIPPKGKHFTGWSIDEKTPIDAQSMKIYSDTTFYALYSSKKPDSDGYITGYDDGTFKPEGNITRAEAAVIISRLCDDYNKSKNYKHNFSDVKKGYWYENPIAYCQEKGYIKGYDDGTFKPDGNITRAEFATILYRVFDFENVLGINVFSDLDRHWGKDAISILYGASVIMPDKDGEYRPDEKLTRGDAVCMINKSTSIIPNRSEILKSITKDGYKFSDVPQYDEKFFDIYSALMN